MNRLPIGLALLALALASGAAHGWNKAGHMTSGAIAYQVLKKESPATLAKVVALLKEHPAYESRWQGRLRDIPEADHDLFLFIMAARWADDARNEQEFHHAEWHYINYPFRPAAEGKDVKIKQPESSNIIRAYALNLAELKDGDDKEKQAVALTWLFHLTGDVHQPLHTATLFTARFPQGDRGGTRAYIRVKEGGAVLSLHQFWDGLVIGSDRVRTVTNTAIELRNRPEMARAKFPQLAEKKFEKWTAESFALARKEAYLSGKLALGADREAAEVLPEGYAKAAKAVAERQMMLAGYRLADLLKESFE